MHRKEDLTATDTLDAEFEIKQLSSTGSFSGYASTFGNIDSDRDIIAPGAFAKSLEKGAGKVKMLWHHDARQPIGIWDKIEEDKRGLAVEGRLLIGQGVPKADEAYALIKARAIDGLSIGFRIPEGGASFDDKKRVRTISQVDLWEISPVTFPANDRATIRRVKGVVPFQDLPLADRGRAWDGSAAEARVRRWAGGGSDIADMDWDRYRRAFLWFDSANPERITSYKLGIADIVGGALTAIPRGIFAAAGVLMGSRGGVDIPDADRRRAMAHLERYYGKMDLESPFKAAEIVESVKMYLRARLSGAATAQEYERVLRDVGFRLDEAKAMTAKFGPQREVGTMGVVAAVKAAKAALDEINRTLAR
jgi:HK97 family phage prohead protease